MGKKRTALARDAKYIFAGKSHAPYIARYSALVYSVNVIVWAWLQKMDLLRRTVGVRTQSSGLAMYGV